MQRTYPKSALEVGVRVEAAAWSRALPGASGLAERAAQAAFAAARPRGLSPAGAEAAVVLADDARMRALNRVWRGQDKPTNVLAFAACPALGARNPARDGQGISRATGQPMVLGDVVVALETARAEARTEGKPLANHLRHLVVHGMLHLLGHDHRRAPAARRMERLERKVLATFDVPDPYAPRAVGGIARVTPLGVHSHDKRAPAARTARKKRRRSAR
ncbi:MAG: rRNA maturation RNase YbeY [Rhodospirillales bacterium]|nr:rRNA maturation RNase YbeY [Rhodospirillales bacterium]MSP80699.1 rRNA maturation RNase YbeY [Rhodospirillales bacterium]